MKSEKKRNNEMSATAYRFFYILFLGTSWTTQGLIVLRFHFFVEIDLS